MSFFNQVGPINNSTFEAEIDVTKSNGTVSSDGGSEIKTWLEDKADEFVQTSKNIRSSLKDRIEDRLQQKIERLDLKIDDDGNTTFLEGLTEARIGFISFAANLFGMDVDVNKKEDDLNASLTNINAFENVQMQELYDKLAKADDEIEKAKILNEIEKVQNAYGQQDEQVSLELFNYQIRKLPEEMQSVALQLYDLYAEKAEYPYATHRQGVQTKINELQATFQTLAVQSGNENSYNNVMSLLNQKYAQTCEEEAVNLLQELSAFSSSQKNILQTTCDELAKAENQEERLEIQAEIDEMQSDYRRDVNRLDEKSFIYQISTLPDGIQTNLLNVRDLNQDLLNSSYEEYAKVQAQIASAEKQGLDTLQNQLNSANSKIESATKAITQAQTKYEQATQAVKNATEETAEAAAQALAQVEAELVAAMNNKAQAEQEVVLVNQYIALYNNALDTFSEKVILSCNDRVADYQTELTALKASHEFEIEQLNNRFLEAIVDEEKLAIQDKIKNVKEQHELEIEKLEREMLYPQTLGLSYQLGAKLAELCPDEASSLQQQITSVTFEEAYELNPMFEELEDAENETERATIKAKIAQEESSLQSKMEKINSTVFNYQIKEFSPEIKTIASDLSKMFDKLSNVSSQEEKIQLQNDIADMQNELQYEMEKHGDECKNNGSYARIVNLLSNTFTQNVDYEIFNKQKELASVEISQEKEIQTLNERLLSSTDSKEQLEIRKQIDMLKQSHEAEAEVIMHEIYEKQSLNFSYEIANALTAKTPELAADMPEEVSKLIAKRDSEMNSLYETLSFAKNEEERTYLQVKLAKEQGEYLEKFDEINNKVFNYQLFDCPETVQAKALELRSLYSSLPQATSDEERAKIQSQLSIKQEELKSEAVKTNSQSAYNSIVETLNNELCWAYSDKFSFLQREYSAMSSSYETEVNSLTEALYKTTDENEKAVLQTKLDILKQEQEIELSNIKKQMSEANVVGLNDVSNSSLNKILSLNEQLYTTTDRNERINLSSQIVDTQCEIIKNTLPKSEILLTPKPQVVVSESKTQGSWLRNHIREKRVELRERSQNLLSKIRERFSNISERLETRFGLFQGKISKLFG